MTLKCSVQLFRGTNIIFMGFMSLTRCLVPSGLRSQKVNFVSLRFSLISSSIHRRNK